VYTCVCMLVSKSMKCRDPHNLMILQWLWYYIFGYVCLCDTVRTQYNDTVGSKKICRHIEISSILIFYNSLCNDILIHCCLYYMYLYIIIKLFYVYFIINMTYNTHNRTTLLKQQQKLKILSIFEMICVIHLRRCSNLKGTVK